jgi:hypothetical protein
MKLRLLGIKPSVMDRAKLEQMLLDCKISPEIMEYDESLNLNVPESLPIVDSRYYPTGVGSLWREKGILNGCAVSPLGDCGSGRPKP